MNFKTGFINKRGVLEILPKNISANYSLFTLAIDILSSLPSIFISL